MEVRGLMIYYNDTRRTRCVLIKVAVNTIVPRSPFFLFLYLKTQTVTHIRKNAVEYLRQ